MQKTQECPRCKGTGRITEYSHIRNGLCFKCSGTGQVRATKTHKAKARNPQYAQEQKRKMNKAMEIYADDSRLGVSSEHEYYYMHAIELAKADRIWKGL